jgi:drug/metabolite transporter (DMT)-like permease
VFAAMLGYNPVQNLLAPTGLLRTLPAKNVAVLTGKQFFPTLISGPFHHGLSIVFTAAALMAVIGAAVSWLRGGKDQPQDVPDAAALDTADAVAPE